MNKGGPRALLALLPTLFLLTMGEAAARGVYFLRNHYDTRYLIAPMGGVQVPVVFPLDPKKSYTEFDPCSGRRITFTINRQGGRGRDWETAKPRGTVRVAALGGSSTFGVNNPDDATWPAYLEGFLRERRSGLEVLNAGFPGYALKDFNEFVAQKLPSYAPDWILYYEGWNDTDSPVATSVHHRVRRLNEQTWFGGISSFLYRRSMLYTYFLEKTQFVRAAREQGLLPRVGPFETELERFVHLARQANATPVFILQVLQPYRSASVTWLQQELKTADLQNQKELEGLVRKALARDSRTDYDSLTKLRVYQTQVLREAVRRTGQRLQVPWVDPQPAFLRQAGSEPLFCDVVHLSDSGNRLLARVIAEAVDFRKKI